MKANEIKRGSVFELDGRKIMVKHMQVQSPSSRSGSTLYKVRGKDVESGQKYEKSFKGDEVVAPIDISRCSIQLLYRDGDGYTFMNTDSYEQYTLADDAMEDEAPFLYDGMEGLSALTTDGVLLGIELPATIVLEVEECAPAMKTASASARTKPATMTTGLVIQVPEYLTQGEKVKINTETREFMSRA